MVDIDAVSEKGALVDGDAVLVVEMSVGSHDTVLGTVSENKISFVTNNRSSHAVSNVDQNSKWPIDLYS